MDWLAIVVIGAIVYMAAKMNSVSKLLEVLVKATVARDGQTGEVVETQKSFIETEIEARRKNIEEWKQEMDPSPFHELDWGIEDRHNRRREEFLRVYSFKSFPTTGNPAYSEADIASMYLSSREAQEELEYWWDVQNRELHKDVLELHKAGTAKTGFKFGYAAEAAMEEIAQQSAARNNRNKLAELMIAANLDVIRGTATLEEARKRYEEKTKKIDAIPHVFGDKDIEKRVEEHKANRLAFVIETWERRVKDAQQMEEKGEIKAQTPEEKAESLRRGEEMMKRALERAKKD